MEGGVCEVEGVVVREVCVRGGGERGVQKPQGVVTTFAPFKLVRLRKSLPTNAQDNIRSRFIPVSRSRMYLAANFRSVAG